MRRRLFVFLLVLTLLVVVVYSYVGLLATEDTLYRLLLAVPFVAIWLIPVLYWSRGRESRSLFDHVLQAFAYFSMGWVSNALVLTVFRDVLALCGLPVEHLFVLGAATVASLVGAVIARTGPKVVNVEIPLPDLPPALDGFRIAQISDLHVSSLIRRPYVERVKNMVNDLKVDLVALTGDIIDGPIAHFREDAAPLAEMTPKGRLFFITGNHEYYAGAPEWLQFFQQSGMTILSNAHVALEHNGAEIMVAGVDDPAVRIADPQGGADPKGAAATPVDGRGAKSPAFRLLLAHNPKLAESAASAGFDLQLSGHTHAGQFLPWTLVVRLVHAPHFAGLSRQGNMWVYVSAGTGTWGPPVRLGTVAELTVIKLVKKNP